MKKIFAAVLCCALMLPTIPAFADTQLENVARNTAASVTCNQSSDKRIDALIDGRMDNNEYTASYNGKGARIYTLNLGGMYNVSTLKAFFGEVKADDETTALPENMEFLYSADGTTYTSVDTLTGNLPKNYVKELSSPVKAQYIQLTLTQSETRYVRTKEIEVYGTFAGYGTKNLALGKSVTENFNVKSVCGLVDGDTVITNAADSSKEGAWVYSGTGMHYATIDLGAVYSINRLKAYFGFPDGKSMPDNGFSTEYSLDNTTYSSLATVAATDVKAEHTINLSETVNVRYVKLIINKAPTTTGREIRVREFEVYGSPIAITNATQSGGATVTATVQDGLAKGLIDGDTTKANKAKENEVGAWTHNKLGSATIDLGAVYSINQINGYFGYPNGDNKPDAFTIDISTDNATWTTFASEDVTVGDYAQNYVKKAASNTNARYIRLTVNALSGDHFRVRELEVYGSVNELYYTKAEGDTTTYTICNYTDSLKNVVVIKATYADNALSSAELIKIDRFAPGTEQTIEVTNGETVFIWDGINTMKPIVAR